MNLRTERIRAALSSTFILARLRARIAALTDAELAEAESLERLGRRRVNALRALMAERKRRAGKPAKMLRLKVEARL